MPLPPAAVISAEKAGLSRALPELLPRPAAYARHRPLSAGEGTAAECPTLPGVAMEPPDERADVDEPGVADELAGAEP